MSAPGPNVTTKPSTNAAANAAFDRYTRSTICCQRCGRSSVPLSAVCSFSSHDDCAAAGDDDGGGGSAPADGASGAESGGPTPGIMAPVGERLRGGSGGSGANCGPGVWLRANVAGGICDRPAAEPVAPMLAEPVAADPV